MTKARDIASATTPNANAALLATFPHRNLIINGAMQASQRGDSTGKTATGYYGPDRYQLTLSSLGTWSISQSSTVPSGFGNSYKLEATTADASPAASDYAIFLQKFEGQNLQQLKKGTASAESVTLSFWVRSSKTGTYIVELFDNDNSRSISASYTISVADTFEYKTITFAGDTTGAFDDDNASSLEVIWYLAAGSTYTSGTLQTSWGTRTSANQAVGQVNMADTANATWYITGIQLELGSTATPFEHRSYGDELAACQRYYYEYSSASSGWLGLGNVYQTDQLICPVYSPTVMRALPTLTKTLDGSSQWLTTYDGFTGTNSNANTSLNSKGTSTIANSYIYITGTGRTGSDGQCHWLTIKADAALHFDAEL